MGRDEPNNTTLSAFILRQASGAFLCRYRNCPRAAQGFRTAELREKHEESHGPRFQCAHAPCGFFGMTFNSRAAMKKHAAQYHDEEDTASVPNTLIRKPRALHEDRSLFALSEVKRKRKVAELGPWEGFQKVTRVASSNSQPALTSSVGRHAVPEGSWAPSVPHFPPSLQTASNAHPTAEPGSPHWELFSHWSPSVEASPFAVEGGYTTPSSPRLTSSAQSTQQQTLGTTTYMSPSEALLDYDELSLAPEYMSASNIPPIYQTDYIPEFPGQLVHPENTPYLYERVPNRQNHQESTSSPPSAGIAVKAMP